MTDKLGMFAFTLAYALYTPTALAYFFLGYGNLFGPDCLVLFPVTTVVGFSVEAAMIKIGSLTSRRKG